MVKSRYLILLMVILSNISIGIKASVYAAAKVINANSIQSTTSTNQVAEISFASSRSYADPFNDVIMNVNFVDPQGVERVVPAFWAGGNVWRVRYASPLAGIHTFKSVCSDINNAGLHHVTGQVKVAPYAGENPLYRFGPIRVADDGRRFAHADGTPFFWLGDTWWMGLVRRLHWPDEFAELVQDRREKGFTVVQLTAGLYGDLNREFDERAEGDGGFPWTQDFQRINPEYFNRADQRIIHLVNEGIVPCIVGSWGYWLDWLGEDKMKAHWRDLIARWGALPVVWCVAGETIMPWYLAEHPDADGLKKGWTSVARYIKDTDPFQRLLTTHPVHAGFARDQLDDPTLCDFDMQQSGHGTPPQGQAAMALAGWHRTPVMPSISGEARYEMLTLKREWTIPEEHLADVNGLALVGTKQARQAFWAHLLNSGCAGHTYGVSGIFQINRDDWKFGQAFSGVDWGQLSWRDAMNQPGSAQLGLAKKLLMTLPWHKMSPDKNIAANAVCAAVSDDGQCAIAYAIGNVQLFIDLHRLQLPCNVFWFDPTNGEQQQVSGSPYLNAAILQLQVPGQNDGGDDDWVLILKSL